MSFCEFQDTITIASTLICLNCGRRFKHEFSLVCHQHGECGEKYRYETGLFHAKDARLAFENFPELASLTINMKKYVCSCGKVYSQKSSLDRHLRYECGKMPNVPCPQCGKMFKHRHHVTQHLKRSMRQQPGHRRQRAGTHRGTENGQFNGTRFFCDACGKSYKWKESLFKHKRVECGKLPQFTCEVCGYRFMHKHHLLKHLTSVHHMASLNGAAISMESEVRQGQARSEIVHLLSVR
ncbi:unnamed protein product [Xylocopa violacea]|uniref:C2H2-type domain-containing protein n=1 Tax=Xylocopa violacea TaxID=135666 RepID=A0ABP1NHE9_XYLVO